MVNSWFFKWVVIAAYYGQARFPLFCGHADPIK